MPFAVVHLLPFILSLGCRTPCGVEPSVRINPRFTSVATLSWATDQPLDDLYAEFGTDAGYGRTVHASANFDADTGETLYQAVLRGLKTSTDYHWRTGIAWDGDLCETPDQVLTTGPLPPEVPTLTRTDSGLPTQWGGFMLTAFGASLFHPVVIDADGDIVWWIDLSSEQARTTRVRLSRDFSSILYNSFAFDSKPGEPNQSLFSRIVRIGWNGDREVIETPNGHHDFVELPDGTLAYIASEVREVDGTDYRGDLIVEHAPDGTTRTFWSSWDHLASAENPDGYTLESIPWGNALDYSETDDTYQLGLRENSSILEIPRSTGDGVRTLGGLDSSFELVGDGSLFHEQHQFEFFDGGVVIFDNGEQEAMASRAVEYALDHDAMTMEQTWTWAPEPPVYTYSMGDVSRLPGGNSLVVWGTQGQIDEVTPSNELVTRFNLALGTGITFVTMAESLDEGF